MEKINNIIEETFPCVPIQIMNTFVNQSLGILYCPIS